MSAFPRENLRRDVIRVVLADDHPVVRIGVRNVLAAHGNFSVVGESENGQDTLNLVFDLRPDILLLDVQMPQVDGFEIVHRIATEARSTHVVLLTASIENDQLTDAFQAGARGIVMKNSLTDQIASAITSVHEGAFWVDGRRVGQLAEVLGELRQQAKQEHVERFNLTRRELEVVGLIVKGLSNREIAKQFQLSEETVKRHLSNIFEKLGISTRLELAILAIERKLVPKEAARS
jgi:two-component system, NarL family, nitrate/nitrite response regulator NarL